MTVPRTSLSALEILGRQMRKDAELDPYPEIRANLLTMIRSYQRMGLDQGRQDIAMGRVFNRRHLLLLTPSGKLRSTDAMHLVVRIEEQNAKGNSALRRLGRPVPPGPVQPRRPVPGTKGSEEAGTLAEVDNDAPTGAGGD